MVESRQHLTAYELVAASHSGTIRSPRILRLQRTEGDERLQKILDYVERCDEALQPLQAHSLHVRGGIPWPNGGRVSDP